MTDETKPATGGRSSAKKSASSESSSKEQIALLSRFLKQQERELTLKEKEHEARQSEITLEKQKDTHQYEYALESLKAQERDRQDERNHDREILKGKVKHAFWGGLVFLVFLGYLVTIGKDAVALKLIAGAVTIGSLAFGSYQLGKNKAKKNE